MKKPLNFKFFNPKAIPTKPPSVTFRKGNITINVTAYALMGSPQKVIIGYDDIQKILAIKPVDKHEFEINVRANKNSGNSLNCAKLYRELNINIDEILGSGKSSSLTAEWDNESKLLLIEL